MPIQKQDSHKYVTIIQGFNYLKSNIFRINNSDENITSNNLVYRPAYFTLNTGDLKLNEINSFSLTLPSGIVSTYDFVKLIRELSYIKFNIVSSANYNNPLKEETLVLKQNYEIKDTHVQANFSYLKVLQRAFPKYRKLDIFSNLEDVDL